MLSPHPRPCHPELVEGSLIVSPRKTVSNAPPVLKKSEILRQAQDDRLATGEIIVAQNQPLDAPIARQRVDDLGHVGQGHSPVKEVVGLDENADAARALVEAAGGARARAEPGQAARL